jgi:hypothetical protein
MTQAARRRADVEKPGFEAREIARSDRGRLPHPPARGRTLPVLDPLPARRSLPEGRQDGQRPRRGRGRRPRAYSSRSGSILSPRRTAAPARLLRSQEARLSRARDSVIADAHPAASPAIAATQSGSLPNAVCAESARTTHRWVVSLCGGSCAKPALVSRCESAPVPGRRLAGWRRREGNAPLEPSIESLWRTTASVRGVKRILPPRDCSPNERRRSRLASVACEGHGGREEPGGVAVAVVWGYAVSPVKSPGARSWRGSGGP